MLSQEAQAVELLVKEAASANQPVFFQYLSAKLEQLGVDSERAIAALEQSFYQQPNEDLIAQVQERVEEAVGAEPLLEEALEQWHQVWGEEHGAEPTLMLLHLIEVLIYTNGWYEAGVFYLYAVNAASKKFLQELAIRILAGEEIVYDEALAGSVPSVESIFSGAIRDLEQHLGSQARWQTWRARREQES